MLPAAATAAEACSWSEAGGAEPAGRQAVGAAPQITGLPTIALWVWHARGTASAPDLIAMRRAVQATLQPLVRSLTTAIAPGGAEVDATAKLAPQLGQVSARVSVPLTTALPGLAGGAQFLSPLSEPPTEVTTLANGLRIVSEASMVRHSRIASHAARRVGRGQRQQPAARPRACVQGPTANVGIYVDSGSIYETPATTGVPAGWQQEGAPATPAAPPAPPPPHTSLGQGRGMQQACTRRPRPP
jgi:hypothetical protein